MTLRGKLTAMTLATIGALIILFAVLLIDGKQRMMEDRQNKVRNLVEVTHGIATHFHAEAQAGRLSEEDARKAAADNIRALRYDEVEYFWINDLSDLMVMHPIRPDLEGKKLDQLKDKNGKFLFLGSVDNQSAH